MYNAITNLQLAAGNVGLINGDYVCPLNLLTSDGFKRTVLSGLSVVLDEKCSKIHWAFQVFLTVELFPSVAWGAFTWNYNDQYDEVSLVAHDRDRYRTSIFAQTFVWYMWIHVCTGGFFWSWIISKLSRVDSWRNCHWEIALNRPREWPFRHSWSSPSNKVSAIVLRCLIKPWRTQRLSDQPTAMFTVQMSTWVILKKTFRIQTLA